MAEITVTAYLRYLQEVSRKILQRGGFENVLHGKTKKQNPFHFDFNNPGNKLPAYLRNRNTQLQEQSGKGLFLGFGLITGQIEKNRTGAVNPEKPGRKRNLSAPLLFCSVELSDDDGPNRIADDVLWESITLNYDLITLVLEQVSRDDEEELAFGENRIAPEKLKVLTDIETELEQRIDDGNYVRSLREGSKVREIMRLIQERIPDFSSVELNTALFDIDELPDHVARKTLTFFNHRFFFVAPVADQLSTTLALRELIHQTE